jgi:hypothetical protein
MNTQPMGRSIVYDANARAFALTLLLPTRQEAEIAYIRAARPELADKVERLSANFPELATRARRAAFLLLEDAVRLSEPGEIMPSNGRYHRTASVLAQVRSETGQFNYLLTRGDFGVVICNCPDASPEYGEEGAPASRIAPHTCKHILAAAMFVDSHQEKNQDTLVHKEDD